MAATPTRKDRIIAIVGRPNVGKSALFNRLAQRRIAIVHDMPGVTRDRLSAPLAESEYQLVLMDTGGIGATLNDNFGGMVKAEAEIAIAAADLILFVVDALEGMHNIDAVVAQMLRKQGKPVILGLNKADDPVHDANISDFGRLGFETVCTFSATHGRGIHDLVKTIERTIGPPPDASEPVTDPVNDPRTVRLAIVGRPNVGKSSLFNAILGDDRAIVSDVAGTTRDSIDCYHEHKGHGYLLIDTAGIRRQAKVDTAVEQWSVQRAERSIRRADLVALVVDASRGVTAQERKIAGTILEENRPCIIVANKFDLYHPDAQMKARLEELEEHVRRELFFLHYAPLVAVSAIKSDRLNKIFGAVDKVREASDAAMGTGAFNRLLQDAIAQSPPPAINGKRFKLFYATLAREEKPRPIIAPRVVLFVNHASLMSPTYRRYLENTVRARMKYEGLPIRFDVREREQRKGKTDPDPVSVIDGVPVPAPVRVARKSAPKGKAPGRKTVQKRKRGTAPGKGKPSKTRTRR